MRNIDDRCVMCRQPSPVIYLPWKISFRSISSLDDNPLSVFPAGAKHILGKFIWNADYQLLCRNRFSKAQLKSKVWVADALQINFNKITALFNCVQSSKKSPYSQSSNGERYSFGRHLLPCLSCYHWFHNAPLLKMKVISAKICCSIYSTPASSPFLFQGFRSSRRFTSFTWKPPIQKPEKPKKPKTSKPENLIFFYGWESFIFWIFSFFFIFFLRTSLRSPN